MSEIIHQKFLDEFSDCESFLLYHSFGSEVQTHQLLDRLYNMKKTVYLPKVDKENLVLGKYLGKGSLASGAFGILEPVECAEVGHIDTAVVPGVAFDRRLFRVGYGRGYYDRLLESGRFGVVAGFAFECQVIDTIFCEPHDIPADVLITEKNIYRRNS